MKLTVLVDNNTLIDRYFYGEPGLSFLIKDGDKKILFDTGYSEAFIKNANKMDMNLRDIDDIVISHGHMDHTWGLFYLIKYFAEAAIERVQCKKPSLIAHPSAFLEKRICENEEIGSMIAEEKLSRYFTMNLSKKPFWLTERLVFLGEIERKNNFENRVPIGKIYNGEVEADDYIMDDSALAYKSAKGLVIITGCSHSGICNIIEHAKKVCKEERVIDVIGGFHLLDPDEGVLQSTCDYIRQNDIGELHPCHCTDLKSKLVLSKVSGLKELGVGSVLEYI